MGGAGKAGRKTVQAGKEVHKIKAGDAVAKDSCL